MICPSHGTIWRSNPMGIVAKYLEWAADYQENQVTIAYDTMWNSTRRMAEAIAEGLGEAAPGLTVKLYNAARNMEIAIWKLSQDRWKSGEQAGRLFLISNELDAANANLSFEREFGRCIGLLDLMAQIVADRSGRTLSRVTQSVATMVFLPVGF